MAIYHSRVDYPGYTPPLSGAFKLAAEIDSEERGLGYSNPADIPISPGGEIEEEALIHKNEPAKAGAKAGDRS